jgi:serine/threonine protein kinase
MHRNVVSCHYIRRIDDVPRVFAEYVAGGDLQEFIKDKRRILDIAIQAAWGLHHAHEHQLVHQDVKPVNLLMTHDGVVKVTDFGLTTSTAMPSADSATMVLAVAGYTPMYASPEQLSGTPLTRRTDVWSSAVTVVEMFAGEPTWPVGSVAGYYLEELIKNGPADAQLPSIPKPLQQLLRECFYEARTSGRKHFGC